MDRQQARRIIQETFEKAFDKDLFPRFIKNLLKRIEDDVIPARHGQFIPEAYRQYIKIFERIGKYHDGKNRIDILIIRLQKETSIERARTMQRNFVAGYLQGKYGSSNEKEAALVAFISPDEADWRFSLVKMDYRFEHTATGRMRVKEEFTPARRWSFLVGVNEKSHTAQSRLEKILADDENNPTLAQLEDAFNIETVTKEFFLKYRDLFIRTKEALDRVVNNDAKIKADFEAKGVNTVDFAKKLLGQIVFLYFLQKKGWFGVARDADWGAGSKQFLRELFEKKHGDYHNFFNDILEPLFYEALRNDRSHDYDYYSRFNCKIPFLNGGLFDPIGNYDWVHTDIYLPNVLFSNRKTSDDEGSGILDIFDLYNFTVKEDEPLEKEVAIDPELLGKAYEKFNAIRPDNFEEYKKALKSGRKGDESKFNKQFGVYYTPREIVHYMCQQSLINYLFTELNSGTTSYEKLGDSNLDMLGNEAKKGQLDITIKHRENPEISKEDIETLIHLGEQVSENEEIALLKENLIEQGKQKTTKNKLVLPEGIRKNAELIDQKLEAITVCDPAVGSGAFPVGMMNEIVKARNVLSTFIQNKKRTTYDFKRRCIEHSLYGVDIDSGAVEIAKLRLWLSLVVDEESIENIKPLPNLDYKIMQGNSLIELLSTEALTSTRDNKRTELVKELRTAKDELFNITIPTQKEKKRHEIDMLMKQLFEYDRDKQIEQLQDKIHTVNYQLFEDKQVEKEDEKKIREIESKIEKLKNIDIPGPKEHYEWHINYSEIFQEKGGFDVVIGNPPYGISITKKDNPDMSKRYSEILKGEVETYILFYYLGLTQLNGKGCLSFISPDSWFTNRGASPFRNWLTKQYSIIDVFDWYKPFDGAKDTRVHTVLLATSNKNQKISVKQVLPSNINYIYRNYEIPHDVITNCQGKEWRFYLTDAERSIFLKMEKLSQPLEELFNIKYGLRTGNNDDYVTETKTKYPLITGADIASIYSVKWKPRYLKKTSGLPAGYFEEYFTKEKIIIQYVRTNSINVNARWLEAAFVEGDYIPLNSLSYIYKKSDMFQIKYVLGIINSFLMNRYYRALYTDVNVKPTYLAQLPIPAVDKKVQNGLIIFVDRLISLTQSSDYLQNPAKQTQFKEYEKQIDRLVYDLYGMTEEEIKIVERSS